jgi:hypothetical protein
VTVELAIEIIRDAQQRVQSSSTPIDWQRLAEAAYVLADRIRAQLAELERERARAGWPVLCPTVAPAGAADASDRLWLEDAMSVTRVLADVKLEAREDQQSLFEAASSLVAHVQEGETHLGRVRADVAAAARPDAPRVEGAPIVGGRDIHEGRDLLAGTPIETGATLFMLTSRGWTPVRYESNGNGPSLVYWSLPGVAEEIPIRVPGEARFAWPAELEARPRHRTAD